MLEPAIEKSVLHSRGGLLRASAAFPRTTDVFLLSERPERDEGLDESEMLRESGVRSRGRGSVRSYPSSMSFQGGLFPLGPAWAAAASGRGQPSELTPTGTIGCMTIAGAAANMGVAPIEDVPHDEGVPAMVESCGGHCGAAAARKG